MLTPPAAATANANTANPLASQTAPPTQNYVQANNPATIPPVNLPPNPNAPQSTSTQSVEMQRLALAQQLAQLAQTLATNNTAPPLTFGAGQPSVNSSTFNPALNTQLYGFGANNPIFTGGALQGPGQPTGAGQPNH